MTPKIFASAWVCTFPFCCQTKKKERMSFSICQLNDALEHASLTRLICVYSEVAVWRQRQRWRRQVGGYCTCSPDGPTQRQQQSGGSCDGQRLIRGSPEQVGFALMPQGFVREENISAYSANTPPITYLFGLSGMMC